MPVACTQHRGRNGQNYIDEGGDFNICYDLSPLNDDFFLFLFSLETKKIIDYIWLFARFALILTFGRRYFRSKTKINPILFCVLLAYSYLCTQILK